MPCTSLRDKFNGRALEIWRQFGSNQARMPSLFSEINEDARLVIVGMNPSFNVNWSQGRMKAVEALQRANMTADDLFKWDANWEVKLAVILELEAVALKSYGTYFKPLERFAGEVDCMGQWQHLDLFLMRETSQPAALRSVLVQTKPQEVLNDFGEAQLNLFIEMVHDIGADAVLIANATASRLAKQLMGLRPILNEPAAFELSSLPGTRFFLSGMLSGQRAIDNYSKARLVSQVRKYLERSHRLNVR